jgi:hypothetical protein
VSLPDSIAHYRITGKLGEGGMGAVYRATDTKLNRDVAIKVIPDSFAADPDRMTRFTREAQVLASLNHPNIAHIYGVEDRAIVMELVEGSEPKGPLSADEALALMLQLADALEYAHEKGVIHRDLKPANLKLTPQGNLKVLDFGLAKALASESSGASDAVNSPTMTMRATMAGSIMGTAAYMSPEQARGQYVDKRADIWSFGVVFYELLTGKQLFTGETVSDTLAAVLRADPDLSDVPPRFRKLLRHCLVRDPRQRLRDISGIRLLLEEAPTASATAPPRQWGWVAAGLCFCAALGLGILHFRGSPPADRPLMRFNAELSPDAVGAPQMTAAISPDGKRLAFRVRTANGYTLATKLVDQPQATLVAGTEGVKYAFFSPDSQWIGYLDAVMLRKIPAQGGAPVTLTEVGSQTYGADWLADGNIVVAFSEFSLGRIPSTGGTVQKIGEGPQVQLRRFPQALPGSEQILVTTSPQGVLNFDNANIDVISLKTGEEKTVLQGGYFGRYLPTGHLIYVRGGTLYGVRFDLGRMATQGPPVQLLEDVSSVPGIGAGKFDFSQSGTLLYSSGKPEPAEQPVAMLDAAGAQTPLNGAAGTCLRLSPDARQLAFAARGDISVYDLKSQTPTRITFDPAASNRHPAWTPDGKHLVYAGAGGIWWTRSDGSGQPQRIYEGNPVPSPWSFAAGGPHQLRLALHQAGSGTNRDIWILPLDVSDPDHPVAGKAEMFVATPENETAPTFSPDGKWMAYNVNDLTQQDIFVRRYQPGVPAGSGGKWQISHGGRTSFPVWGGDGAHLFFRSGDGKIRVVDYTTSGETFSAGMPRDWSPTATYLTGVFQNYDMFPDGKHAVVVALDDSYKGGAVGKHATVLLNFFDDVTRRLAK